MWTVSVVHSDGSLRWQSRLQRAASVQLDLQAPETKFLTPWDRFAEIGRRLGELPAGVVFFGSGSLHHLSYHLVLRQADKPLILVVFDRHGDFLPAPEGFVSCGSWLLALLGRPEIEEAWLVGPDPPLSPPAKLRWIAFDQVETSLGDLERLRKRVYVSIDKDVLLEASTDWGSGSLETRRLLDGLAFLRERCELVGVDVCGEIIPRVPWPTDAELRAIRRNEEINLAVCRVLLRSPLSSSRPS